MKRKETETFKAYKNPAYEYIQINREKILISIFRSAESKFQICFHYNGKKYDQELPRLLINIHTFSSDDIIFKGIELNIDEKEKIADRLNQICDLLLG